MISSAVAQETKGKTTHASPKAHSDRASNAASDEQLDAEIQKQEESIATTQVSATAHVTWWTTTNAMTMSATVLVFGLLTLLLAGAVMRKGYHWEAVLKIFGMVLVVVMTVFLIVAGYDDKQISGAIGLLGTIAGYLLGKDVSKQGQERLEKDSKTMDRPPI